MLDVIGVIGVVAEDVVLLVSPVVVEETEVTVIRVQYPKLMCSMLPLRQLLKVNIKRIQILISYF